MKGANRITQSMIMLFTIQIFHLLVTKGKCDSNSIRYENHFWIKLDRLKV